MLTFLTELSKPLRENEIIRYAPKNLLIYFFG